MSTKEPILSVRDMRVEFKIKKQNALPWHQPDILRAVKGVSFDLAEGETLGIVGESGCGKSTLARAIIRMIPSQGGEVFWQGRDLMKMNEKELLGIRKEIQMIFQDPLASLNPRLTAGQIIAEPLKTHFPQTSKDEVKKRVRELMEKVGLSARMINRYPHEFSGGQCQRIGIARALITNPKMIICDEPVSALDVSVQAQVVNLLMDLQQELGLSLLFIAHDLSVVKHISNRIMVLEFGDIAEIGDAHDVIHNPQSPYTKELINAVPIPDPIAERKRIAERRAAEANA
ncbi:oligopeptide transport ATP-binding protein OppF [Pseudovibrio sp. FO-BEG1]|uniref:ATP-binding cassette domain-containing protein n=1 Tax=unclassified Pseudovibrio TaxID=2627060 RepID=UPI000186BF21|nr:MULTISPECIES: ATP-binding cassette domain-containing protein [unclassified Pseudovibrio]AEV36497.1 oligopeptide transport ATP-binding protein OppF [Pseudovibrio sp. FO-BEG1]EEA94613.1 oligopeptide ABC transporter, ATP-binding protein [Pseudovibrio sp. JE062]